MASSQRLWRQRDQVIGYGFMAANLLQAILVAGGTWGEADLSTNRPLGAAALGFCWFCGLIGGFYAAQSRRAGYALILLPGIVTAGMYLLKCAGTTESPSLEMAPMLLLNLLVAVYAAFRMARTVPRFARFSIAAGVLALFSVISAFLFFRTTGVSIEGQRLSALEVQIMSRDLDEMSTEFRLSRPSRSYQAQTAYGKRVQSAMQQVMMEEGRFKSLTSNISIEKMLTGPRLGRSDGVQRSIEELRLLKQETLAYYDGIAKYLGVATELAPKQKDGPSPAEELVTRTATLVSKLNDSYARVGELLTFAQQKRPEYDEVGGNLNFAEDLDASEYNRILDAATLAINDAKAETASFETWRTLTLEKNMVALKTG